MKLFNHEQNINQNQQSQAKLWFIKSNFIPTYIIYKYIFTHFELRPDPESNPDPVPDGKKNVGSSSLVSGSDPRETS